MEHGGACTRSHQGENACIRGKNAQNYYWLPRRVLWVLLVKSAEKNVKERSLATVFPRLQVPGARSGSGCGFQRTCYHPQCRPPVGHPPGTYSHARKKLVFVRGVRCFSDRKVSKQRMFSGLFTISARGSVVVAEVLCLFR